MSDTRPTVNHTQDYLLVAYQEAWRQYVFEGSIGQTRNNVCLTVNAGLLAVVAAISPSLLAAHPLKQDGHEIRIGFIALGIIGIVLGLVATRLLKNWAAVTKAGRAFAILRRVQIRAIEDHIGSIPIKLGHMEHEWRKFCQDHPGQDYRPYDNQPEETVPFLPTMAGWASTLGVIDLITYLWYGIIVAGVALTVGSLAVI